jgi:hypothetical protein
LHGGHGNQEMVSKIEFRHDRIVAGNVRLHNCALTIPF